MISAKEAAAFQVGDRVSFYGEARLYEIVELTHQHETLVITLKRDDGVITHAALQDIAAIQKAAPTVEPTKGRRSAES